MDVEESIGKSIVDKLNLEFGKNRTIFLQCDVTKNSEFDGIRYFYLYF